MLQNIKLRHFIHKTIRKTKYKSITSDDILHFSNILTPKEIITQDLDPYNIDFTKKYIGSSKLALQPTSVSSLQAIMKYCNSQLLPVVPQGGNTGLVGGNVPVFDQIVVSLRNINKIQGFDQFSNILSCQTGCILQNLNQYLSQYQYQIPWDLGAKGSCHIGGNVSTNAGGKYFIKYGPLRANILGIETVMANGQVLNLRSKIRKDNTGIDLKQILIGSEGSLGIITSLDIQCVKVDKSKMVVLIKTDSFKQILNLAQKAKKVLGKNLNSLQYMDGFAYNVVFKHLKYNCPLPLSLKEHSLLIQINGEALDLLQFIPESNQSVLSSTQQQYNSLWKIRQSIAQAANRQGLCYKYDLSFDVSKWDEFIKNTRQKLRSQNAYVMGYGHIGDGNLHLNICLDKNQQFDQKFIIQEVIKNKGSISAQHGIGQHKAQYLHLQKQPKVLQLGKQIKKIFDPNLILNPYKLYND